jgi:hypothetical protein
MVEFVTTVQSTIDGNKYYIDGVQAPIIPVVTGGTFRFNQNAATNNNHPLVLSTTTSTAGIISSGVSYYLDGVSNQANYTNTSLFNAATVWGGNTWGELGFSNQVSSSASAGQVSAFNNQGWGRDYWGKLSWGVAYENQQVEQSGFSLSSNLGTISISSEINLGWGRLEWGENAWGIGGDVIVDGQQLTSATGFSNNSSRSKRTANRNKCIFLNRHSRIKT